MQRWHPFLLIGSLALLLAACAQAAPLSVGAQSADPTAAPEVSAMPGTDVSANSAVVPNDPPDTCPVTPPPDPPFTPPPPYPQTAGEGYSWYGTDSLWMAVPKDGVWSALPHNPEGYTQKVFWWSKGYSLKDELEPQLSVAGRRLDAPAPPLNVSRATNASAGDIGTAMLVGVDFPMLGCWEIMGIYKGHELSFVVWVAP